MFHCCPSGRFGDQVDSAPVHPLRSRRSCHKHGALRRIPAADAITVTAKGRDDRALRAGVALGFLGNRYWSFRHSSPARGSFMRYLAAYAIGYVVNLVGLHVGVDRLNCRTSWSRVSWYSWWQRSCSYCKGTSFSTNGDGSVRQAKESDVSYRIPFNKPCVVGSEIAYVREAIDAGRTGGDGPFTKRCQQLMERQFGAHKALLTTSCTSALETAALLGDLKSGDEVILPSYTFVSTANAIVLRGATPVFVDVRADTLNLDERLIEDRLRRERERYGRFTTRGLPAKWTKSWGWQPGTVSWSSRTRRRESLHPIKGDGSELSVTLVVTAFTKQRTSPAGKVALFRQRGTTGPPSGDHSRKRHQSKSVPTRPGRQVHVGRRRVVLCSIGHPGCILLGQLECMEHITATRGGSSPAVLRALAAPGGARTGSIAGRAGTLCKQLPHVLSVGDRIEERTALIAHLKRVGIMAVFHYVPLHTSPVGRSLGGRDGALPVTEEVSTRLIRLPLYYDMTGRDVSDVVGAIHDFYEVASPS